MHTAVVHSSRSEACRWNGRGREGRKVAKDDATSDRPSTARADKEVEAVCRLHIDDVANPSELLQNIQTSTRIRLAQWWSKLQSRERCAQDLRFAL
jgi:transposase